MLIMINYLSNNFILIVAGIFLLIISGCSNCDFVKNENNISPTNKNEKILKTIITEKLGKTYSSKNNYSNSYSILQSNEIQNPSQSVNKFKFIIVDLSKNEIIFEDELLNANVDWVSEFIVQVSKVPGIIKKDYEAPPIIYKFDVLQKIKINN